VCSVSWGLEDQDAWLRGFCWRGHELFLSVRSLLADDCVSSLFSGLEWCFSFVTVRLKEATSSTWCLVWRRRLIYSTYSSGSGVFKPNALRRSVVIPTRPLSLTKLPLYPNSKASLSSSSLKWSILPDFIVKSFHSLRAGSRSECAPKLDTSRCRKPFKCEGHFWDRREYLLDGVRTLW